MMFVSNIGWFRKVNSRVDFEIINQGYLFSILESELIDLLNHRKENIIFSVPLKNLCGIITLSRSGGMIIIQILEKEFGTPIRLVNDVLEHSAIKPISEIVDRSEYSITKHEIYHEISTCINEGSSNELSERLRSYENATVQLIKTFHGDRSIPLDYNDLSTQTAYMVCYFPYYIENVYRILKNLMCPEIEGIIQNNMIASFYGCGPAPDLLGYLAFLKKYYDQKITDLNVNFFDSNGWDLWRTRCVQGFSNLYNNNITLHHNSQELDLLRCVNRDYFSSYSISGSKLHIFQNCVTDIYHQCSNMRMVYSIFDNFCHEVDPGSIIIINDLIGKGDSMKILLKLREKWSDRSDLKIIPDRYNVDEYKPNIDRVPEIERFISTCSQRAEKEKRQRTGYTYLVVQRHE